MKDPPCRLRTKIKDPYVDQIKNENEGSLCRLRTKIKDPYVDQIKNEN